MYRRELRQFSLNWIRIEGKTQSSRGNRLIIDLLGCFPRTHLSRKRIVLQELITPHPALCGVIRTASCIHTLREADQILGLIYPLIMRSFDAVCEEVINFCISVQQLEELKCFLGVL